jgi:hypothetical protein
MELHKKKYTAYRFDREFLFPLPSQEACTVIKLAFILDTG